MKKIVIIGNGITGITAAREIRKRSEYDITVISGESHHHFSRPALMYIYMGHMRAEHTKPYEDWFWDKNRISLRYGTVTKIDFTTKAVLLESGESIAYDKLILATGSKSNKFGWKGQDLKGVQGLYSLQDVEMMEENTKHLANGRGSAVVVGGGLIGIEVAEMLHSRHIPVTFLVRENIYWGNILPEEEGKLVERHIRAQGIDLRLSSELQEITSDSNGRARSVITKNGEELNAQFVALTAGVSPNTDLVKGTDVEVKRGILVNEFLETNLPDVYAAGDCAELKISDGTSKVEQLWYTGRMQAEALAKTICGNRTKYQRGIWFNSAKFFDIEYQTYGFVANKVRDGESHFYWEDASGTKSFRIVFQNASKVVTGVNTFGIRQRQAVWQRWIAEERKITDVLTDLGEANFDPEFYKQYEPEIISKFNQDYPESVVTLRRAKGLFSKLQVKFSPILTR
ncbi:MAG: FAD-dependent oxidoreductase [Chloroherpetonaceae bacterium]|nr:FAD-dependent oxidoreductase [Chloroherpetonaceae bacterium]